MATADKDTKKVLPANEDDLRAIRHLKESIARGKHWYLALLESIKFWNSAQEDYRGRHFQYLIAAEAFDWLLLAERLCQDVRGQIPEGEMINLLFYDRPPVDLPKEEFKNLIGQSKYKAYLNFSYGILMEEALVLAVMQEVRKERRSLGSLTDDGVIAKAYSLIYGLSEEELLRSFMRGKGYLRRKNISLGEVKEFTFWLFKYRLKHSENSRFASDTKKALLFLQGMMASRKGI